MSPENFAYWLQGFLELSGSDDLTQQQVFQIRQHLALVFDKKIVDPYKGNGTFFTPSQYTEIKPDFTYWPEVLCCGLDHGTTDLSESFKNLIKPTVSC